MSFEVKDPLDADLVQLFNAGIGQTLETNLAYAALAIGLQNGRKLDKLLAANAAAVPAASAAVTLAPPA